MGNLTMSRRTFSKLMAATTAAVAVGASFSGQKGLAQETAAQSAAAEEGVRKIRSCCRGCGKVECGVWVYVKDGRVIPFCSYQMTNTAGERIYEMWGSGPTE